MTVYLKENIPERFHYKNNPRIPSILVLADPGHAVYDVRVSKRLLVFAVECTLKINQKLKSS